MRKKQNDTPMTEVDAKRIRRNAYVKMAAMVVIVAALMAFGSIAWFTMSREVEGSGVQMGATGRSYLIKTADGNNNGAYFTRYHSRIPESDASVWLVDENSNLQNNEYLGIKPGSKGKMTFYVIPLKDEVRLDFELQTTGYQAVEHGDTVEMNAMSNTIGNPAFFLNGHLLLFEGKTGNYFNGLIPVDAENKRTISRTFRKSDISTLGTDTDGDNKKDAFAVDIYWTWPETLSTIVNTGDATIQLLCDPNAQVQEGAQNDYRQVLGFLTSHPAYFLKGYDAAATISDSVLAGSYSDYGSLYDRADQDISSEVHFVLLTMEVKERTAP